MIKSSSQCNNFNFISFKSLRPSRSEYVFKFRRCFVFWEKIFSYLKTEWQALRFLVFFFVIRVRDLITWTWGPCWPQVCPITEDELELWISLSLLPWVLLWSRASFLQARMKGEESLEGVVPLGGSRFGVPGWFAATVGVAGHLGSWCKTWGDTGHHRRALVSEQ